MGVTHKRYFLLFGKMFFMENLKSSFRHCWLKSLYNNNVSILKEADELMPSLMLPKVTIFITMNSETQGA